MSRGNYPLLRPNGQPWTPTAPAIDHPLRELPHWVLAAGKRLAAGQALTADEKRRLDEWCEVQRLELERL